MKRIILFPLLLLIAPTPAFAQSSSPPASPAINTLLGAEFVPVPELLQIHLPNLPKDHGLIIETVKSPSVAKKIGLRRHDLLLKYQETPVRDSKHLADLLLGTPPGQSNQIHVLRSGKPLTLSFAFTADDLPALPASAVKAGGPPAVRLEAEPLQSGKLKITLTCYTDGSKQQTVTATGTPSQIEEKIRSMIQQEQITRDIQDLVEVALQRLRDVNKR